MAARKHDALRSKIYRIIFCADTPGGRLFDLILLWLILLSILSVFLESIESFSKEHFYQIRVAEWVFTILFTFEYLLRIYSSKKPLKYIFSFYGFIDLIGFLPTYLILFFAGAPYLVVIRAVRLLRIFRILNLDRFLQEGNVLKQALKASMYKIVVFLTGVLTIVTIIGTLMYVIEGRENGFTSIPKSIYWAIVTITTVGYGDLSPQTPVGQVLASLLMIIGYGILAVPTGIVSVEMARAAVVEKLKCPECQAIVESACAKYCASCGARVEEKE